jgi:NAD(P)-dependent dehydrogenase (short-subunit alcohol dehydrogenase family)
MSSSPSSSATHPQTVLITGVSRGLGLALLKEYLSQPNTTVIGTVRSLSPSGSALSDEAKELFVHNPHPRVKILEVDIGDDASVEKAASTFASLQLGNQNSGNGEDSKPSLDVLILNAGIGSPLPVSTSPPSLILSYLNTNTLGAHRTIQAFLPYLRNGREKKVIFVSSQSGSLSRQIGNRFGLGGVYGVSKCAENMLAVQWHNELNVDGKEGFVIVPLHPG